MPAHGRKTKNSSSSAVSKDLYANEVATPCKQCQKWSLNLGYYVVFVKIGIASHAPILHSQCLKVWMTHPSA